METDDTVFSKTDEPVHLGALSGWEEGQVAGKQTNQSVRLLVTNVCRSSKGPGRE